MRNAGIAKAAQTALRSAGGSAGRAHSAGHGAQRDGRRREHYPRPVAPPVLPTHLLRVIPVRQLSQHSVSATSKTARARVETGTRPLDVGTF